MDAADGRPVRGRRYNCRCGKKRHRDEPAALRAAAADAGTYGGVITVYRCPGGLAWHVTSTGFLPESLRTTARRLAYELVAHREVDLDDFRLRVLRLNPGDRKWRRVRQAGTEMWQAGLVTETADRPGVLRAADEAGLRRVVQIGLDAYLAEQADRPA